jgi:hypothetical protein
VCNSAVQLRHPDRTERVSRLTQPEKTTMKATLLTISLALGAATFLPYELPARHAAAAPPALDADATPQPRPTLRAFRSEAELTEYLRRHAPRRERQRAVDNVAQMSAAPLALQEVVVTGSAAASESVTNVQHAGVDEGGIVKVHGDHLVILRRGRLFTVRIGDDTLQPVSAVDAFGPELDPRGAWYDELLISGDRVAVIGYSYHRRGTEVGLFEIDRAGRLRYLSTYQLRSNDYYSSRNYASRLVGDTLIFYTPLYLNIDHRSPLDGFPAMRRWQPGAQDAAFRPIITPTRVYRPVHEPRPGSGLTLHTVTQCAMGGRELRCEATAVLGPAGRVFYVSPTSVYVWTSGRAHNRADEAAASMLYRIPLNGSAPTALGVEGAPVDQFSFLESGDRHLNVLVRSDARGEGMWGAELAAGEAALLRVPLTSFTDGSRNAPSERYRALPTPGGHTFQNRFVGEYLLYGSGSGWGRRDAGGRSVLYAVRWAGGEAVALPLRHGVDRIEAMGPDAVVVGSAGNDLHFTSVRLRRGGPSVADGYVMRDASQGELRSHGFFYRADTAETGVLGLPVRGGSRPGYAHLREGSASILFLRNEGLRFRELGPLEARPETATSDSCRASCVDWYGNARPLFLRGRVFALLGYELVEGRVERDGIREARRVSFAPGREAVARR